MIQVFGDEQKREYEAACSLRDAIIKVWPTVVDDPVHDVRIIAGAKCHGQKRRDIDILLLASFGAGFTYRTFLAFQGYDEQIYEPDQVQVDSLCVAIEVKDHSDQQVRFVGTTVEVLYQRKWHNASEQNEEQIYSVKRYLQNQGIHSPWVSSVLWLRNIPSSSLPKRPHNIVGAHLTWDLLLNVIGQMRPPRFKDGSWHVSATTHNPNTLTQASDIFTKVIKPTRLDRQRMERLGKEHTDLQTLENTIGKKLLLLHGRGGTGKTMRLLQFAKYLFDEQGARILILTYNKALVADILRLLDILEIGNDIDSGAIHIQTVHSFLHAILKGLDILDQENTDFFSHYEMFKEEALNYFRTGTVSREDIEQKIQSNYEHFRWDYIFVDEGQDWPNNERDLLLSIYDYSQIVVADGVDQLVRGFQRTDWRGKLTLSQIRKVSLEQCLRLKTGLVRFVTTFAHALGLSLSHWKANEEIPGGRVIVVRGSYLKQRTLHDKLLKDNEQDGNKPVDMLFCVPPALVTHQEEDGTTCSEAANVFEQWGFSVWDGASEDVRESYPTEEQQLRIVQYDSCRGLEGWIVVCLGLDEFYAYKKATLSETDDLEQSIARWLLIPLTRAMDTLVIQIDDLQSPLYAALVAADHTYPGIVQWVDEMEMKQ
jgi:DNA polymerase III delta prime subunit